MGQMGGGGGGMGRMGGKGQMGRGMGMPGMSGGMGGMSMGHSGATHGTDQGLTRSEVFYILSMQDILQVVRSMMQVQERLANGVKGTERAELLKEMKQLQEKVSRIEGDYRQMLTGQIKNQ
jgi:hypothetical protein